MSSAVVFVGGPHQSGHDGDPPGLDAAPWAHPALVGGSADLVVAADSGLHLALAVGWRVDRIVGDLDSVDPDAVVAAGSDGALIRAHPPDKDATDLELALDEVVAAGCSDATVIGADAGRLDHLFGSLLTICSDRFASLRLGAWLGSTQVLVVRDRARFEGRVGAPVSLIAVHGGAFGVRTAGLRWPLLDEALEPGSSRGLSNELVDGVAEVGVGGGCIAVVIPGEEQA